MPSKKSTVAHQMSPAAQSSLMLTVVWLGVPALTPPGRFDPKASSTLSPSSSSMSSVAENVIVCDVSPLLKVTLDDTGE